jgi:hypothetical protein
MIYTYQHPETGEIKDVSQPVNAEHVYSENGVKWNRVFNIPYTASNTKVNPFSKSEFVNHFDGKKVTVGDISEASAEMSATREQKLGQDPVKTKFFDDYSKKRRGINHPDDPRPKEAAKKRVEAHLNKTLRLPTG